MPKEDHPVEVKDLSESGFRSAVPQPVKTKPWWKRGGRDFRLVSANAGYPVSSSSAANSKTALDVDHPAGHNAWEMKIPRRSTSRLRAMKVATDLILLSNRMNMKEACQSCESVFGLLTPTADIARLARSRQAVLLQGLQGAAGLGRVEHHPIHLRQGVLSVAQQDAAPPMEVDDQG